MKEYTRLQSGSKYRFSTDFLLKKSKIAPEFVQNSIVKFDPFNECSNRMKIESQTALVDTEEIVLLHFPKEDILFSKDEQLARKAIIEELQSDNTIKTHTFRIIFQDIEGLKAIVSRIWGLSEKEVILKKGVTIPTQRILKIDYEIR